MQIKLDFSINDSTGRRSFVDNYVKEFGEYLTDDNLEMLSNYILWAVEREEGLDFGIESKRTPWKGKTVQSYEEMLEAETQEGVRPRVADVGLKCARKSLDRGEIQGKLGRVMWPIVELAQKGMVEHRSKDCFAILGSLEDGCRDDLQGNEEIASKQDLDVIAAGAQIAEDVWQSSEWHPLTNNWFSLWQRIDETEFMVQTYEAQNGKRRSDLPIRPELYERLAQSLVWQRVNKSLDKYVEELTQTALTWEPYVFLKRKRTLVSLRTEQYALLDSIQGEPIQYHPNSGIFWSDADYEGINGFLPFMDKGLLIREVQEQHFGGVYTEKCVEALSRVDKADSELDLRKEHYIDLRNPDVVRALILNRLDLEDYLARIGDCNGAILKDLLKYLDYYIEQCKFSEDLEYILKLKMNRYSNKDIVEKVELKYGMIYKENYISTIFTKRIIEAIIEQVNLHFKLIEFITMGQSVFKKCSICGRWLPRNSNYYNKRTSTSDGFFNYCKDCKTRKKT